MTAPTYGSATADPGIGPQPTNAIVVSGTPSVQYLNVETATNCYAGRLVKKGTHDNDIVVCTAGGAAVGVLGYEHAPKKYRPATRATIYAQNDQAPVLSGKGVTVLLYLAQSQTVSKGDKLVAAASGMVSKASAAEIPSGTVAVASTSAQPTVTGPIPTEGPIVATAEESVTTTDEEGWIMATLER